MRGGEHEKEEGVSGVQRHYFRCKNSACPARRFIDQDLANPSHLTTTYRYEHSCKGNTNNNSNNAIPERDEPDLPPSLSTDNVYSDTALMRDNNPGEDPAEEEAHRALLAPRQDGRPRRGVAKDQAPA